MIAVGLGFRAGASEKQLANALEAALAEHKRALAEVACLCVPNFKRDDANLAALVRTLAKPLVLCTPEALRALPPTLTQSLEILRRYAVGSLSEACALHGALQQAGTAHLCGPRLVAGSVTCALAISESAR